MLTHEDVESYLVRTEQEFQQVDEGMWTVGTSYDGTRLVVNHDPPVLVFRLKVMDVPQDEGACGKLFRRLLELNATDLVHAAYGIEEDSVILSETLELENLDFNEFQATVDSFQMALASHLETLVPFRSC